MNSVRARRLDASRFRCTCEALWRIVAQRAAGGNADFSDKVVVEMKMASKPGRDYEAEIRKINHAAGYYYDNDLLRIFLVKHLLPKVEAPVYVCVIAASAGFRKKIAVDEASWTLSQDPEFRNCCSAFPALPEPAKRVLLDKVVDDPAWAKAKLAQYFK